jgi:hypothetical protein
MTDHNDTGATARPWREALRREPERYAACSPEAISHGSQAQMKYFVADAQHDIAILATRLAEVERERDDFKERLAVADASLVLETGAGIDTHETMLRVSKQWCARAHAAEARVAVLEKVLESIRQYGSDTLSGRADGGSDDRQWQREAVREMTRRARTALAEQK